MAVVLWQQTTGCIYEQGITLQLWLSAFACTNCKANERKIHRKVQFTFYREHKFAICSMRQDSELMDDQIDKMKTITSKSVSSGRTSSLLSLIPDKKIIDNTLARQSIWKNEMKANTLQRLMVFWVRRFSLHNSVRTWSPMNHLAEPGLKGAGAEARASWFYFIPPQRIDGAALAALYLLIVMDPQRIYSLTNSLRLMVENRGKRSVCW